MEDSIGRNVNVSVDDFNSYVLGVSYILAGCEPQGYILLCCSLVKNSIVCLCKISILLYGETKRHLRTRINECLLTDKKFHLFKHLLENSACKNECDEKCFTIIDSASSSFRLKLKGSASHYVVEACKRACKYHQFSVITPSVSYHVLSIFVYCKFYDCNLF